MFVELAALVILGQQSSSPSDSALVDGDQVHVFLSPFLVAEGTCLDARWSDDGQYLIVVSEKVQVPPSAFKEFMESRKTFQATSEVGIYIASMRTGTAKQVWHAERKPGSNAEIQFFRKSDAAVVHVSDQSGETTVLRVTAGTSRVEIVETLPSRAYSLSRDPLGKFVASTTNEPRSVRFIGPSGDVLRRQPYSGEGIAWSKDGQPIVLGIGPRGKYVTITPGSSEKWVNGVPAYFEETDLPRRIAVQPSEMVLPGVKEPTPMVLAAIEGRGRSIVVAVGAEIGRAGDSDDGVFYKSGTLNVVRPVIRVTKAAYDEMLARAERTEVMSRLSQIGKALMMYASDNDDQFPAKDDLDSIQPYLGDASLLQGFAYNGVTHFGDSPATTEAGFMLCPGGKAVLFQDGHVVFVPDR